MDQARFDELIKRVGATQLTRGHALRGLAGGTLAAVLGAMLSADGATAKRKQRKHRGRNDRQDPKRIHAQQEEPCWRAGACLPKKGSNVSRCNLHESTAFNGLDCTGCNVSRANLRGADARRANFTRANLSGSCLVDADFTGATFAKNTNLANAVFCRTTMPSGSVNNSGCGKGTRCCPTCPAATCQTLGKQCGSWPDPCSGTVDCGNCAGGAVCTAQGTCEAPPPPPCGGSGEACCAGSICDAPAVCNQQGMCETPPQPCPAYTIRSATGECVFPCDAAPCASCPSASTFVQCVGNADGTHVCATNLSYEFRYETCLTGGCSDGYTCYSGGGGSYTCFRILSSQTCS